MLDMFTIRGAAERRSSGSTALMTRMTLGVSCRASTSKTGGSLGGASAAGRLADGLSSAF
jgi:hypothetical protein